MSITRKIIGGGLTTMAGVAMLAGPAFAGDCTNASKDLHAPLAGVQVIFGETGPIYFSKSVQQRIAAGVIDPATGAGFHGIIAFQTPFGYIDTYIVGPHDHLPTQAQNNGPACKGITSIETYVTSCLG